MRSLFTHDAPLPALGMSSLVLGTVALVLSFLPVLGVPISGCGLLIGVVGIVATFLTRGTSLRWSLAGVALCSIALVTNFALAYAPGHERIGGGLSRSVPTVTDRPFVSPPASGEVD